jgi:hypothetical protein
MAADPRSSSRAHQYAEAIIRRLNEYLSIRFDQAVRINPRLKTLKQDLLYHETENVRNCLLGEKIYGATRQCVAIVIMSDDEKKRRGLLSPSDQTSIQVELVSHVREEIKQATRGQVRIHDLKTFYAAIDPTLTEMMDLLETWIWWDIQDSAELARFEQKLGIVQSIRQGKCTPELRRYYTSLILPPEAAAEAAADAAAAEHSVTDEEILNYEMQRLVQIRDQWKLRRQYDHGYMFVLQRDELPAENQGELIHKIAERVREYDRVDSAPDIDEDQRHYYAPLLKLAPNKVDRKGVLAYLQARLLESEREMVQSADSEARLGPPYRYKLRQLDLLDKWLKDLAAQLKGIVNEPTLA